MKVRILGAAVGAAVSILLLTSCDTASSNGRLWEINPDVAMHKGLGHHLMEASGGCGNGTTTWIARNVFSIDWITEEHIVQVDCGPWPAHTVGTWGLVPL